MNDLRTSGSNRAETEPATEATLTAIRGIVRRLFQGVKKQQAETLAIQLHDGVPAIYLARQTALMEGLPLPARPLADSAVRALAVIAEARLRFQH